VERFIYEVLNVQFVLPKNTYNLTYKDKYNTIFLEGGENMMSHFKVSLIISAIGFISCLLLKEWSTAILWIVVILQDFRIKECDDLIKYYEDKE
jgi:hypothetical protein